MCNLRIPVSGNIPDLNALTVMYIWLLHHVVWCLKILRVGFLFQFIPSAAKRFADQKYWVTESQIVSVINGHEFELPTVSNAIQNLEKENSTLESENPHMLLISDASVKPVHLITKPNYQMDNAVVMTPHCISKGKRDFSFLAFFVKPGSRKWGAGPESSISRV